MIYQHQCLIVIELAFALMRRWVDGGVDAVEWTADGGGGGKWNEVEIGNRK